MYVYVSQMKISIVYFFLSIVKILYLNFEV